MKRAFETTEAKNMLCAGLCVVIAFPALAQDASFSAGPAKTIIDGLIDCGRGSRVSAVGEIESQDGTTRTVPANTNYRTTPHAPDLYNACGGVERSSRADLDLSAIKVFDAGGSEEFTAYVFADNYFEFYVNGTLIAVDPVPFTPFNSNVIRFVADRPVTLAVMGVDWEENLALGSEAGRGSNYHPGDAGLVMHVQDAEGATVAITNETWRAQTFYTSPLLDRSCLVVDGQTRDSSACSTAAASNGNEASAAFWDVPSGWMQPNFDDSAWPLALTYSNDTVGVNNKPAYTNFVDLFDTPGADAEFIWASNLVLDNLVLMRTTIR